MGKKFWIMSIIGAVLLVAGGYVDDNMIIAGGALLIIALIASWRNIGRQKHT